MKLPVKLFAAVTVGWVELRSYINLGTRPEINDPVGQSTAGFDPSPQRGGASIAPPSLAGKGVGGLGFLIHQKYHLYDAR
jgi:hypothetical protein